MVIVLMALMSGYLGWRIRTTALYLMARRSPFFSVKRDFYKAMGNDELAELCEVGDRKHRELYGFSLVEVVRKQGLPNSITDMDLLLEESEMRFKASLERMITNGKRV